MKILLSSLIIVTLAFTGCSSKKDGAGHGGGFSVPVVGVKVEPSTVDNKISVVGSLVANEMVEIKSQVEGKISAIHFEEGQQVDKDDVIIEIDRAKEEAQLAEAESNLNMAKTTFTRMGSLIETGAVSKQEYDQAKSQLAAKEAQVDLIKAQMDEMVIKAPFHGVIASRQVSLGQVVAMDRVLTTIIDDSPMKLDFRIPERYVGSLEKGQVINLSVAAYPNETFKGEVYFIDPQVDQASRTVLVKAMVPNDDHRLRSGMFAKLDLITSQIEDALMIPETALVLQGDKVFVFTVDSENKAQMNLVEVGIRQEGRVQIVKGLKPNDVVITEGTQKIGPTVPVMLAPAEPQAPAQTESTKEEEK